MKNSNLHPVFKHILKSFGMDEEIRNKSDSIRDAEINDAKEKVTEADLIKLGYLKPKQSQ